jgi:hypothetical protein
MVSSTSALLLLILAAIFVASTDAASFSVTNKCGFTVYVAGGWAVEGSSTLVRCGTSTCLVNI